MRKILFITGTRADFGKLKPLALECVNVGMEVKFFITGMHMLRRYGETRHEVRKLPDIDFFEFINQRNGDDQNQILTKTVGGLSDYLCEHTPDLVVIHGDRVEATAAALVCGFLNIRSAHIEGGEVSGTIDEALRHCNTKLCTHHFVSSNKAAKRIMNMGEAKNRIHIIGSPELDIHLGHDITTISEVKRRYQIKFDDYGIVIFHPVTTELSSIANQAEVLFDALDKTRKNFVVILPNNDPGSESIFRKICLLDETRFRVLPSMRFEYFSTLMKNASLMIGNSSAGVREAPALGIPSIDTGTRQSNRSEADSVVNVGLTDPTKIISLIDTMWGRKQKKNLFFGDGTSAIKFIKAITSEEFWELPLQKRYVDSVETLDDEC